MYMVICSSEKGQQMNTFTRKQKDGKTYIYVDFTFNNKRVRKSLDLVDTAKNRKLVKNKILPELQHKLNSGMFIENKDKIPTLNEFKVESFAMHKGTRRESTQDDYRISYDKHIAPHMGEMKLDKVKPSHIAKWQSKLLETLSPSRVRNIRAVLTGIFKDALIDEIIDKNPVSLISVPKIEKTKITPFSEEDIFKILDNSQGQNRNFFALGFFTGMRSGEMIGLKWSDIDFTRAEINISRGIRMGRISATKTIGSTRTIDIIGSLMPFLLEQKKLTGDCEYVFVNDKKEHIYDIKRIRDTHWKKTLQKAELKYRTIYQTRHTFATVMLENGEDILWVSNMLGHVDATMTLAKYAKYVKRENKIRASFLENSLAKNDTILALSENKVA